MFLMQQFEKDNCIVKVWYDEPSDKYVMERYELIKVQSEKFSSYVDAENLASDIVKRL